MPVKKNNTDSANIWWPVVLHDGLVSRINGEETLQHILLPPPLSHTTSWETSSMTSLGRKGNTKIAGQHISQLWAPKPRPDQGSQYVFNVSDSSTNCSLLSLSLFLSPIFFLFHHPPLSITLCFSLDISSLSPRLCGRRGKVTRSTLGSQQCAELLQVQGIICCFGKEEEVGKERGWDGKEGRKEGRMKGRKDYPKVCSCTVSQIWALQTNPTLTWFAEEDRGENETNDPRIYLLQC